MPLCPLSDIFIEILQIAPYGHHELIGVSAINNAVVVAEHQADDVANGDGIVAILIGDYNRFLEDAAHTENSDLRLENNGRPELRPKDSRIGNGDGASLDV